MRVFERLRALRDFERQHLPFLQTVQDFDLVVEIGLHEIRGRPLSLKHLYLAGIGGVATLQRRLARLKRLGMVKHQRVMGDRRHHELTLSGELGKVFALYNAHLNWKQVRR